MERGYSRGDELCDVLTCDGAVRAPLQGRCQHQPKSKRMQRKYIVVSESQDMEVGICKPVAAKVTLSPPDAARTSHKMHRLGLTHPHHASKGF